MSSSKRGATTQWVVSAWTTGGNLPTATVRLQATPTSAGPTFDFGCGSDDGTASCDLGAMDAQSAQRQLQAESKVAATASSVKSVTLTVIGSAANLSKDPSASATVQISGTVTPTTSPSPRTSTSPSQFSLPTQPSLPITTTSPLPVGDLPGVSSTISPTLSPGGNAGNLFPTLQPSPGSSPPKNVKGRAVADSTALPGGASVVGASLIGLAALALAFVLAVTRFSIRRRPAPSTAGAAAAGTAKAQNPPPDAPAAPAAAAASATGAAGAADAPATDAGGKAPSDAPEPSKDAPKPPEAPADPPADSSPNPDA